MKLCLALALLGCIAAAQAFVCTKDFCDNYECKNMDDCSFRNGIVRIKQGVCGCCDICVIQLNKGDYCGDTLEIGIPPEEECGEDLYCDEVTLECTEQDSASSET